MAITAAMADGTGLDRFQQVFPERFYDVGIAEQHAVTFAAGLAAEGMKPVPAIYSTFLQRAYDQVRPRRLSAEPRRDLRARPRGPRRRRRRDPPGALRLRLPAHAAQHGRDGAQGRERAAAHAAHGGGVSRAPRRCASRAAPASAFRSIPRSRRCRSARRSCCATATTRRSSRSERWSTPRSRPPPSSPPTGISAAVLNARFVKPLDRERIVALARRCRALVTVEEHAAPGGFGAAVLEVLADGGDPACRRAVSRFRIGSWSTAIREAAARALRPRRRRHRPRRARAARGAPGPLKRASVSTSAWWPRGWRRRAAGPRR